MVSTALKSGLASSIPDLMRWKESFQDHCQPLPFCHSKSNSDDDLIPDPTFLECVETGLATALLSRVTLCYFLAYLVDDYCPEILLFVLETYYLPGHPGTVFHDYLAPSAPLELNLPEALRQEAFDAWLHSNPEECFNSVKPAVLMLLENRWENFLKDFSSHFLCEKSSLSTHTFLDLTTASQYLIQLFHSKYHPFCPAVEETASFSDDVGSVLHSKLLFLLKWFFDGQLPPSLYQLLLVQVKQEQDEPRYKWSPKKCDPHAPRCASLKGIKVHDFSFKACIAKLKSTTEHSSSNSRSSIHNSDSENEDIDHSKGIPTMFFKDIKKSSGIEIFSSDILKLKKEKIWKSILKMGGRKAGI